MNGEIKIKLPHGVKVVCPSTASAVTLLKQLHFNTSYAPPAETEITYPNVERERRFDGPPLAAPLGVSAGWNTHDGEGFVSAATVHNDRLDEIDNFDDQYDFEEEEEQEGPWDRAVEEIAQSDSDDQDEDDDLEIEPENFTLNAEEVELEEPAQTEAEVEPMPSKANTRSRHSGSIGEIYVPLDWRMGDRTKKMLEFVRNATIFSLEDAYKHAKTELKMKMTKKNKRKVRDSLDTLKKSGVIYKISKGTFRKVA